MGLASEDTHQLLSCPSGSDMAPAATKEAGKSFSYALQEGADVHGQLTLSVLKFHHIS